MTREPQRLWRHRRVATIGTALCLIAAGGVHAADAAAAPESWSVHGQFTSVTQHHPRFGSPYEGPNSLTSAASTQETADATLFLGTRLWRGGEGYLNPEIDQGFGLSDTLGVAGFPSGEAYKVGKAKPYFRLNRAFIRHVIALGGPDTAIEPGPNALAGTQAGDNLTLTAGKLSVVDIFDTNSYAHDPRADFLNWAIIDAGAFDYAADAWGYTYGAAMEWTQGRWTARGGLFALSDVPNSQFLDKHFRQYALIAEFEERHEWNGRPGKLKLLGFVNRGRMARYDDALQLAQSSGGTPDVSLVRRFASRPGVALNLEQELAAGLGAFARVSANDGSKEAFEFTEINKSVAAGLALKGVHWGRPADTVGLAGVVNGMSSAARRYFAAGGLGILIGDGQLPRYGAEQIVEAYYAVHLSDHLGLAADLQHIVHPAYNRDRGPVNIVGLRLHAEF